MDGDKGAGGPQRAGASERTEPRGMETDPVAGSVATRTREEAPAEVRQSQTAKVVPPATAPAGAQSGPA